MTKFRLYSKPAKKYIDYITIGFLNTGELRSYSTKNGVGPVLEDNYVVEQYTGLKDKNGKEIYEGDIVRRVCQIGYGINDKRVEYPVNGRPVLIKWNKEGCGWSYFLNGCGLCRKMGWASPDEVEVVGNIHENPELLGGEE